MSSSYDGDWVMKEPVSRLSGDQRLITDRWSSTLMTKLNVNLLPASSYAKGFI